ncbi:MAG: hypothetical protein Kow0025_19040 [Thermodesulfovibrionales bacterium]
MYKKISDYGIIGNLHSAALVALDGSIDWMCLPRLDSPSVFGALLDEKKGGRFSITPVGEWDSSARYVPDTNVLTTRFRTREAVARVTDFMPVGSAGGGERHELLRLVEAERGGMDLRVHFAPRFDYGRAETVLHRRPWGVSASGGGESLALLSNEALEVSGGTAGAVWRVEEGQRLWLHLKYGAPGEEALDVQEAERALRETETYWRDWLKKSETGRSVDLGPYKAMVHRSALVLKLLFFSPTGTMAAAATTSLPESIGGERNWDYRFTWLRDTSFTLQALFDLGHLSETEGYLRWIEGLLSRHGVENMQVMYGLRGETDLREEALTHLDGYKGSRPVRVGNGAATQKQLDIYGELMDAALKLSDYVGKIDFELWPALRNVCDHVVRHWRDRDNGIWEVRGGPYHFVYSKVMCWLALDRGLTIAGRYGFPADTARWEKARDEIRKEVLERGWNEGKGAFVQHYETGALDAAALLMPIVGFLPFDDPKAVSTMEAVRRELGHGDFLYRYTAEDGLRGGEGAFLLCGFWLIDNLIAMGRLEEAERLLHRMEGASNHLGLFSEEYDAGWREALGNFPQAFTHIGYINSVTALCRARAALEARGTAKPPPRRPEPGDIVLNAGEPSGEMPPEELAATLKGTMNVLRGAYFDTPRGRVAYELMGGSKVYRRFLRLSYDLKAMDPGLLKGREEAMAFWLNLYNVIVIHGVIELGIRDSVKEVKGFFSRVKYRIGGMLFSPEDIEHGVLRGNRRPPHAVFRRFRGGDPRLAYRVEPMDPRLHFALVCASASCPPIDAYTPEDLDRELNIAGRTFLNAGGISIDRARMRVSLSRIFKWYGKDFAGRPADRLRAIAPYLYRDEDREFLLARADRLRIHYQEYDWRLNRI